MNRNDPPNEWWSRDGVISLPTANWKHLCMVGSQIKSGSSGVIFLTKLDVGEMLRADLETESLVRRWGNQKNCWGTFLILGSSSFIFFWHFGHLPCLFECWFVFFNKIYQLFIQHPPGPGYCSLPCYRAHAAGQCPARPDREPPAKKQKTQVALGRSGGWAIPQGGGNTPPPLGISFSHYLAGKLKAGISFTKTAKKTWKCRCWSLFLFLRWPCFRGPLVVLLHRPRKRNRKTSSARWGSAPFEGMWACAKPFKTMLGSWPRGWGDYHVTKVVYPLVYLLVRTEYWNHQDVDTLSFCLLFYLYRSFLDYLKSSWRPKLTNCHCILPVWFQGGKAGDMWPWFPLSYWSCYIFFIFF